MDRFFFKKTKPNQHLAGKYDTNKKRQASSGKKRLFSKTFFASVLTTAKEMPKNKGKNSDKMCQLIFWIIYTHHNNKNNAA